MTSTDSRLTRDALHGLAADAYFWALMAPAWDAPDGGTAGQRALAVTTYLVRDVENGGLHQALWNRTAEQLAEALSALDRLGATEHAAAVRAAVALLLGDRPPDAREARRAVLGDRASEQARERLAPLDEQLYDETRLWPYYRRYIAAHPAEFFRE
ncbi:DMP19 family protein [Roseisolibacter agri]|uniref:DMP19 family protein n=1 Tax=Roseisolibacter agri TaxID=2014610 RepID=UPI0024E0DF33|nr:DUF4375 domain-containing protein [Roseisolibacter agri]